MKQLSIAQIIEDQGAALELHHLGGDLDAKLAMSEEQSWPADLVGHLNLIHPSRLQVIGKAELAWGRRQPAEKVARHLREILSGRPPALILADDCPVPEYIRSLCTVQQTALFSTPQPAASVIDRLRLYLSRELAEKTSLHGVFMDVLGIGVLITGDSGAGKSELAIELISRGHGLVADDVVELSRIAPMVLEGRCPELLQDFIEVRGIGILNIRTIFGETACRRKKRLRLVCHLDRRQPGEGDPSRLPVQQEIQHILGVPIPRVVLPVAAGRNLAVLLEAAVRSTILQLRGIDAMEEFIARQARLMSADGDADGEEDLDQRPA